MTPGTINSLCDTYTSSDGLVNYILLFRTYLHALTNNQSHAQQQASRSQTSVGVSRVRSLPALHLGGAPSGATGPAGGGGGLSNNNTSEGLAGSVSGLVHPWDFTYHRTKHPVHPYWHDATAHPKPNLLEASRSSLPGGLGGVRLGLLEASGSVAGGRKGGELSLGEKGALLAQYNNQVLSLARKCFSLLVPHWREIRADFKYLSVPTLKDTIMVTNFISVCEKHGVSLSKVEMGLIVKNFRGFGGGGEVVRYDDFLKVCMLAKDWEEQK